MSAQIEGNTQSVTESAPADHAVVETSWHDTLPEDIRSEASLKDIKDIGSLAKGYVSAQKMLGGSIRIPSEHASVEAKQEFYDRLKSVPGVTILPSAEDEGAWNQFYNALGRPETADKYTIEAPESFPMNPEVLDNFKNIAHGIGLTTKQANQLAQFAIQNDMKAFEREAAMYEQTVNVLKSEWKDEYDNRMNGAKEMIRYYGEKHKDSVAALGEDPLTLNPIFTLALAELYGNMKEKVAASPASQVSYGKTPEQALAEIRDIENNLNHPYFTAPEGSRERNEANALMQKLRRAAHGDKKKGR